jgi:pimeloyl-ACP methyl ester carboxylesterase
MPLPAVREGMAKAGDTEVHYYDSSRDLGAGSLEHGISIGSPKPPVVLLHGTGGSAETNFWALYPMLAMRHRVIAFDFVDPSDVNQTGTLDEYVAQAVAVIEAVRDDGPCHVVGYSFGAVIALALAAKRPDLVAALVSIAGWATTDAHQLMRNSIWQQLYDEQSPALAEFMVFTAYSHRFILAKTPAELEELILSVQNGPDRSAKMRFNRTVAIAELLIHVAAPTLVIGCTEDMMVPVKHARLLYGGIDNARYVEVIAGHAVVHERPAELFTLIDTFLKDPEATPANHQFGARHA